MIAHFAAKCYSEKEEMFMVRNVSILVRGTQRAEGGEESVSALRCDGTLERRGDGWRIVYEERTEDGVVNAELLLLPRRAALTRTGAARSRMLFGLGERRSASYALPFGRLPLETELVDYTVQLDERGGCAALDYRLFSQGAELSRNRLTLELTPR